MVGILNFILWFFVILFLLKFMGRLLAPFLLRYFANKMQSKFQQQFKNFSNQSYNSKKEGEVTIEKQKHKKNNKSKDIEGEYIDFEEIED